MLAWITRTAAIAGTLLTLAPLAIASEGGAADTERLRQRLDAMRTAGLTSVGGAELHAFDGVRRFYARRGFEPLWTQRDHTSAVLDTLRAFLRELPGAGLCPSTYHAGAITARAEASHLDTGGRVDLELLATDAALVLAMHLAAGRVSPESFDPEWFSMRAEVDPVALLVRASANDSLGPALRALHPHHPGYRRLLAAHDRLRQVPRGAWPAPPPSGPALRAGERGPAIDALRARLVAMGDLAEAAATDSAALDAAIRRFQARNGLDSDGVVGAATRARLLIEPGAITRTLALNLERWRWLPVSLGKRHIRVNIAGFVVELVDGEHIVRTERAVVGREYRRTPVFSASMRYVVLNPSWEVPPTILKNDLAPAIRKDPSILAERGIVLLSGWGADERRVNPDDVDWSSLPGTFPYRVRQLPGPTNPLGKAKLIFPNSFSVYMHDTTARELFARASRTMSSGCIRVENPLAVTAWALDDADRWSLAALEAAVATGTEQTIPLREPLPVHLEYWTAWVDEDGTLNLRPDVYGRDRLLEAALEEVDACE